MAETDAEGRPYGMHPAPAPPPSPEELERRRKNRFPTDRPLVFVNDGKGYVDMYAMEPDIASNSQTMLYQLAQKIEAQTFVNQVRGVRGLKQARVRINHFRKAEEFGTIAPNRDPQPPYDEPPQLYKSNPMPPRRLMTALRRLEEDWKGGVADRGPTGVI